MNKKRSSVITPPPSLDMHESGNAAPALDMSDERHKEALIKLIRKGAPSVPQREDATSDENERVRFSVRLSRSLLERINTAAESRDLKTPVNTWITEAIIAQLKKEGC